MDGICICEKQLRKQINKKIGLVVGISIVAVAFIDGVVGLLMHHIPAIAIGVGLFYLLSFTVNLLGGHGLVCAARKALLDLQLLILWEYAGEKHQPLIRNTYLGAGVLGMSVAFFVVFCLCFIILNLTLSISLWVILALLGLMLGSAVMIGIFRQQSWIGIVAGWLTRIGYFFSRDLDRRK